MRYKSFKYPSPSPMPMFTIGHSSSTDAQPSERGDDSFEERKRRINIARANHKNPNRKSKIRPARRGPMYTPPLIDGGYDECVYDVYEARKWRKKK